MVALPHRLAEVVVVMAALVHRPIEGVVVMAVAHRLIDGVLAIHPEGKPGANGWFP